MHIQNRIESGIQNNKEVLFIVNEIDEYMQGHPAGKMITDSDELSFVYLFDQEEGYGYVHFSQAVWPLMVDVILNDLEPVISFGNNKIPLVSFKEELSMLLYNIEGNDNYGEAFTSAVEEAFKPILQRME